MVYVESNRDPVCVHGETMNPCYAVVAGWNALTDAQKLVLWSTEQQYQLGISDARAIEESFYEARSAAFAQFEAQKQQEFVALQNLWQAKEDAPFDVDYVLE